MIDALKNIIHNEGIVIRLCNSNDFILRRISSNNKCGNFNLVGMVKEPKVSSNKNDGILFKIGVTSNSSLHSSSPIDYYTRLIIDYDNNTNDERLISKFTNKFKKYSFILYTTFSSTFKCPKFRVILKINNILYSSYLKDANYRQYLINEFTIGNEKPDESCFFHTQCQLLPITERKYSYKYIINKGTRYKLLDYEDIVNDISNSIIKQKNKLNRIQDINEIINDSYLTNIKLTTNMEEIKNKRNEVLKRNKSYSFKYTNEYKNKDKELTEILQREKQIKKSLNDKFSNKNDFLKKVLTRAIALKNLNYFYRKWKAYYGFDIKDNEKWTKKFEEFLPKLLKYMKVEEKELI